MTRFFISSVTSPLVTQREQIRDAIKALGHEAILMEDSPARAAMPENACLGDVNESDVLVLIVGPTYGTVTRDDPAISITRREYCAALQAGMDVLAHCLPIEEGNPDAFRLTEFKDALKTRWIYARVENASLVNDVMTSVRLYLKKEGARTRLSFFQRYDERFRPETTDDALIPIHLPLVGRGEELDRIKRFILDASGPPLLLIDAPGGAGKSKLVYETARAVGFGPESTVCIRFASPHRELSAELAKELPQGNVVVIIDDAHKEDRLESIVRHARSVNAITRFVVSSRPGAEALVEGATTCVAGSIERMRLARLGHTEATKLASHVLSGSFGPAVAEQLARGSSDNPLLIVVGGRLVRDHAVEPALLETENQFRRVAFGRLLQSRSMGTPEWERFGCTPLLEVVAAVGPIVSDDLKFQECASRFIAKQPDEIARGLSTLTSTGLLRLRGRLLGVSPDMLGDHLLHEAALGVDDRPTTFIDRVMETFAELSPRNLLRNIAELQWRVGATDDDTKLIDPILESFEAKTPTLSFGDRARRLDAVAAAAAYVPVPTLRLVRHELGIRVAPESGDRSTFAEVRAAALRVLSILVRHPATVSAAAKDLLNEAIGDDRQTGPNPEHPRRVLGEALEIRAHSFVEIPGRVLVEVQQYLRRPGATTGWLPELVSHALNREGEVHESDGRSITLGSFDIRPYANLFRPVRQLAIALLTELSGSDDLKTAASALREIANLLRRPRGSFNRRVEEDEVAFWRPEAEEAIGHLAEIGSSSKQPEIRFIVRLIPRLMYREWWPEVYDAAMQLRDRVSAPPREDLMMALIAPWLFHGFALEHQDAHFEGLKSTAARLAGEVLIDGALVDLVADTASRLETTLTAYLHGRNCDDLDSFSRALGAACPERIDGLVGEALDRSDPRIATMLAGLLVQMAKLERWDRLLPWLEKVAQCETEPYRWVVSGTFRWLFGKQPDAAAVLRAAAYFIKDPTPHCRSNALQALRSLRGADVETAVALVLESQVLETPAAADAFNVFDDRYGIPFNGLRPEDLEALVSRLILCPCLGAHQVEEFMKAAFRFVPHAVISALLARVRAAAEREDQLFVSDVLPWFRLHRTPFQLRHEDAAAQREVLTLIRDAILPASYVRETNVPPLFAACAKDLDEAMEAVREWLSSREHPKVAGAAELLAPLLGPLIFVRHELVAEVLDAANDTSAECIEEVRSTLWSAAFEGVYMSHPGRPSPRALNQVSQGARLAEVYKDKPHVAKIFEQLRSQGRSSVEEAHLDDEHMGAEDEGF